MPKKDIDYSKTIIYKIVCNDLNITDVYVGHTTNFIKRKARHKYDCNNINGKAYNYKIYTTIRDNGGFENWSMIEIEKFQDCNDINEASARERYYYELLNAKLNTNCPARNIKEYRQNNKDKINVMKNTPHICDICNGRYTYANRAIHFKSPKHQTALNNNV